MSRCVEDVQRTSEGYFIGQQGILYGFDDGYHGGKVKYRVDSAARRPTGIEVANIAFDYVYAISKVLQVAAESGTEVVQYPHGPPFLQQPVRQMAAYESRAPGYEGRSVSNHDSSRL
jgi:hypothetical protein